MIEFNKPIHYPKGLTYIEDAIINNHKLCGDGPYTKKCHQWIESQTQTLKALLTTSGTSALEMSALLSNIQAGDEVICPSFTFVSTVNAFVLRGAVIVFVDIRPDTLNIDENLIESAITAKTKAIVPVHYAGVACEMDSIMAIAKKHNLLVIEDAAQGVMSSYKGKALGAIGDFGCFSFHETKNYTMGEGGALLIQNPDYIQRAEIVREKGTDRSRFLRGQVDKYSWVDLGSSYLPSDINAAYLYAQLEDAQHINETRLHIWNRYWNAFNLASFRKYIELPFIPEGCVHNGHMFYIKAKDLEERTALIAHLKEKGVQAVFHYVPLHSAEAGKHFGRFHGKDVHTTQESERLIRLPLYYGLTDDEIDVVISAVSSFYSIK